MTVQLDQQETYPIIRSEFFTQGYWPSWLPMMRRVRGIIRQEKIDRVLFGHYGHYISSANIWRSLHGIPYDVMSHGIDSILPLRSAISRQVIKWNLARAERVFANSEKTAEQLRAIAGRKVIVAHPAIEYELWPQVDRARLRAAQSITDDTFVLLSVARLIEMKGIDTVLRALASIKLQKLKYYIVGDGPDRQRLEKMVHDLELDERVIFVGAIKDDPAEKACWYGLADCFILTPRELNGHMESFGTVYLEAARYALPIIASRGTGAEDCLKSNETSYLVNQDRSEEVASNIMRAYSNPEEASRIGRSLNVLVGNQYQWQSTVSKLQVVHQD